MAPQELETRCLLAFDTTYSHLKVKLSVFFTGSVHSKPAGGDTGYDRAPVVEGVLRL